MNVKKIPKKMEGKVFHPCPKQCSSGQLSAGFMEAQLGCPRLQQHFPWAEHRAVPQEGDRTQIPAPTFLGSTESPTNTQLQEEGRSKYKLTARKQTTHNKPPCKQPTLGFFINLFLHLSTLILKSITKFSLPHSTTLPFQRLITK